MRRALQEAAQTAAGRSPRWCYGVLGARCEKSSRSAALLGQNLATCYSRLARHDLFGVGEGDQEWCPPAGQQLRGTTRAISAAKNGGVFELAPVLAPEVNPFANRNHI